MTANPFRRIAGLARFVLTYVCLLFVVCAYVAPNAVPMASDVVHFHEESGSPINPETFQALARAGYTIAELALSSWGDDRLLGA